ncbi:hypothetical protein OIU79_004688 [Salix purpurea]|uniref:Uncharacterized protein n=1 Tax=Salix purpurea TaxID=77065 RepID=A0A9Q0Z9Y2_SALPP|nr:hypothetical protein OIU79_004688 [Salix purpurea]
MCGLSCTAYLTSHLLSHHKLFVCRLCLEGIKVKSLYRCLWASKSYTRAHQDRNATTLHSGQNAVVPRSSQVLSSVGHRPGLSDNSPSYAWCRSSHDRGAVSRYQVSALSRPALQMLPEREAVENSSCPPMAALLKRKFPSSSPSLCPDSTKQNELLATYNVSSPRNCSDEKRDETIFHDPRRASKEKFPVDADQKSIHRKQYGSAVRLQLSTTGLVKTFMQIQRHSTGL